MRTIPQVPSGLQGLTSCCKADATFQGETLVCRACRKTVTPVAVTGHAGNVLEVVIKAWLDGKLTAQDVEFAQEFLMSGGEPPTKPKGYTISAEEIEKAAETLDDPHLMS